MPRTLRRKVVVLGDPAVGKSALVHMFSSSGTRFPKQYNMTCGVELAHKLLMVAEGEAAVELYMFDSGGQDLFDEMMPPLWEGEHQSCWAEEGTGRRRRGRRGEEGGRREERTTGGEGVKGGGREEQRGKRIAKGGVWVGGVEWSGGSRRRDGSSSTC